MIRDRRGEGGFMEAIVALSAVTVALTVFLGLLSYAEIDGSGDPKEPDTEFISGFAIEDGEITGYDASYLERYIGRNGLNGAELKVSVAGHISCAALDETVGIADGNNIGTVSGTFPIHSDDNRTFVASYEVVYWWD